MSLFSSETVKIYADSLGLPNLSDEVLQLIAHDTEYRIRELLQVFFIFILFSRSLPNI